MTNLSLYSVTAVIILDAAGSCVLSKYYDPLHPSTTASTSATTDGSLAKKTPAPTAGGGGAAGFGAGSVGRDAGLQGVANPFKSTKEQRNFEKGLFDKTRKASGDILLYANHLVLYKASVDLTFYVVGPEYENELMLQNVLMAFHDAVSMLLRHQVEKRSVLENLDLVVLALDETIDDGIILETDATAIASRCSRPRPDPALNLSELKIDEQSLLQAFSTVRDRVVSRIGQI